MHGRRDKLAMVVVPAAGRLMLASTSALGCAASAPGFRAARMYSSDVQAYTTGDRDSPPTRPVVNAGSRAEPTRDARITKECSFARTVSGRGAIERRSRAVLILLLAAAQPQGRLVVRAEDLAALGSSRARIQALPRPSPRASRRSSAAHARAPEAVARPVSRCDGTGLRPGLAASEGSRRTWSPRSCRCPRGKARPDRSNTRTSYSSSRGSRRSSTCTRPGSRSTWCRGAVGPVVDRPRRRRCRRLPIRRPPGW
jgi:hypothetical protein